MGKSERYTNMSGNEYRARGFVAAAATIYGGDDWAGRGLWVESERADGRRIARSAVVAPPCGPPMES
jgi:hypothetical protein